MTLLYSFDTSALIGAWRRRLPPDVVPSFWKKFDAMIAAEAVGCIDEVKRELERQSDEVLDWAKSQSGLFIAMTPDVFEAAARIVARFPSFTKPGKSRNAADPFVIALGQIRGATVVTEEQPAPRAGTHKIPDACTELGIACIDVYGFVRAQGWSF